MSNDNVILHPDYVGEVVEELLSSDIISKEKITKLKDDKIKVVDPNVIMDIRHKEVKKESLIDFTNKQILKSENKGMRDSVRSCLKPFPAMKDLKTIDKEIATTKKNLLAFQNQLLRKHENFLSHIEQLEDLEREQSIGSPQFANLNKEEAKNHFNFYLDDLENGETHSVTSQQLSVWKPFQDRPSSVNVATTLKAIEIKPKLVHFNEEEIVITTLKAVDIKPKSVQFNEEELQTMKMLKMDPINIKDETLLNFSLEDDSLQEIRTTVPNNTPSLYPNDIFSIEETKFNKINETNEISRHAIRRWKLFATKKRTKRNEELENRRVEFELVKKMFARWVLFVNQTKEKKEEDKLIYNHLKKSQGGCTNKKAPVERSKEKTRQCLDLQKNNLDYFIDLFPFEICPRIIKSEPFAAIKNIRRKADFKSDKARKQVPSKLTHEGKVNIKTINPEELGLVNNEQPEEQKQCKFEKNLHDENKTISNKENLQKSKPVMVKSGKTNAHQEPINNRFAAQEKIIAQQLEVIEDQKRMIFDLQAQNLQVQSKLSLQVAESELAKASCNKKLKPIGKAPDATRKISCNLAKLDEKSEQLCKSMVERQEYCKQLAERTKLRKMRIEEQKAKLKLEQEEREKQEKEEEKRQKAMKVKLEQQLAKEKAQKYLVSKWQISELTTKAINHYNKKLLLKTFKVFKKVYLEKYLITNICIKIYERSLLKLVFVSWRSEVKQSLVSKLEMAEKYHCTKLMERYWITWRRQHQEYKIKVQVSEDMYALKLQERMFRRWTVFAAKQYLQTCCRLELADRLHRKQMLRHVFRHWRELPKLMFVEREREQRRRAWRQAVQELIPDFTPVFADKLDT